VASQNVAFQNSTPEVTPKKKARKLDTAISPALKDFIDTCLVPIMVKNYLEQEEADNA
jgi:hypothetical protein